MKFTTEEGNKKIESIIFLIESLLTLEEKEKLVDKLNEMPF